MESKTELAKQRDFGDLIGDTFVFIGENFKHLIKYFFVFCGLFILLDGVGVFMLQVKIASLPDGIEVMRPGYHYLRFLGLPYLIIAISSMFKYTVGFMVIISYMALYKLKGNNAPTVAEILGYLKRYFWRVVGSGLIIFVLLLCAAICFIIPGIWLYPILSLIIPIIIIENTTFSNAFNECFDLVKGNWWTTFGALLIMGIIAWILKVIVQLPVKTFSIDHLFSHLITTVHVSTKTMILSAILRELAEAFSLLVDITLVLCYYSLTAQKESERWDMEETNDNGQLI